MRASLRHHGSFALPFLIALLLAFCAGPSAAGADAGTKAHAATVHRHGTVKKHTSKRAAKKHKKATKKHKRKVVKKHKKKAAKKKTKKRKKAVRKLGVATTAATLSTVSAPAAFDQQARLTTSLRVSPSFFGVVANEALGQTGAQRDGTLADIRNAGAGLLRQKMDWATIERTPGVYDFSWWDQYMLATARAGLQVLPVLFN